ncbi:hypothetical protein FACS18947_6670 [Bacteroidia bacterium]|nr:hypothetical protein FACS18947_6670 [Bacteroidia bacterium]
MRQGDYYTASMEAVNKLRSSPDKQEVQSILTSAYPLAVKMALREIDNALASNNASKYDVVVAQYERLNRLADEIYRSPKASELIPQPQEFQTELRRAKNSAAEQSYTLGVKALDFGTIEQARTAHQHFLKAYNYVNDYRDVMNKINESRYAATLRVIVEAPVTPTNFQISAEFFYNNLLSEMSKRTETNYVRLYTPEEAKREKMHNPHQYMVLDFAAFTVGNIVEVKNTTDVKRDSVVTGTVKVDGKDYNAYATVKAKFTKYQREISSGGTLDVRILDASNNRVIEQRKFSGSYVWKTTWGSYTGDDRALAKEQKDLSKREPQLPPPNQDLFLEFTKPIYTQVVSYVRGFYNGKNSMNQRL